MKLLQWTRKKEVDETIKRTERETMRAEVFFKNCFGTAPAQATEEIKRIQEKIRIMQDNLQIKNARILEIMDAQDKALLAYHTQKLLAEIRPDKHEITQIPENLHAPPQTVHERLLHERIDRRLNIIPDENFQNVLEKLPRIRKNPNRRTRKNQSNQTRARKNTQPHNQPKPIKFTLTIIILS
ncbi:MAG: hypothetical protein LBE76_00895 [Nitrososphaerota archaeon]|nr:hypothetical protein [Nitrososphaerota archaeon]